MSIRETGETRVSPFDTSAEPPPTAAARPSWEAAVPAPPPAAAPRPVPTPRRPIRPASADAPRPYYAAAPPPVPASPPPAAPYQEEAVQYDLAGNPLMSSTPAPAPFAAPSYPAPGGSAYAPPAPFGYSAGAAASWPPPVANHAPGSFRNTSGEAGEVPPEIARLTWNWGAFFFPVMWCRKHGLAMEANVLRYSFLALVLLRMVLHGISPIAFVALGALYGTAYSGARIYFALKGHQMGWRSRHFPGGLPEYFQVQKAWMWWGFGISAVWTVVLPVMIFLGVLGAGLSMPHNGSYGNPYGGRYSRPAGSWPTTGNAPSGDNGSPSQGGN